MRQERIRAMGKMKIKDKYYVEVAFPTGWLKEIEVDRETYERTLIK